MAIQLESLVCERQQHGQKRVSNRVKRPCRGRDRVLRVSSAEFDLRSPRRARAAMKSGGRDLKRATRAFGFVWSFYLLFWAGRRALHELARGGINAPQRRDLRERDAIGSKLHTFFGGRTAPGGLSR